MVSIAVALAVGLAGGDSTNVYRGSAGQLSVRVPRVEDPRIRVDARLDEPAWAAAAVLTGFTQYEPTEGVPALDDTEIRVLYADDAIYFGIRAFDSQPDRIRAKLGERDRSAFNDDWVRVMLDTYADQRQAYIFYVNPLGIQTDGIWQEGRESRMPGGPPIDFSPDFIWTSEGRIVEDGWVAELRIPYVSLRFRETPDQTWGLNVARETRRNGFKTSWAPLTKDRANQLAQSGTLHDLRDLHPRRLVELNPVVTGRRTGERTSGGFATDEFSPEFGFNARLGLTQNLVADATYNPDFSQVEADADQITVNERFAIFLQEKRPFFLEGSEVFRTPRQLVYTRQIVDPSAGARLTGRVGSFSIGFLGAVDESALRDETEAARAAFGIVRLQRDVGPGSSIGALYTDRSLLEGGAYNRVLGVDTRLIFRERYSLTAQLAQSWTREAGGAERSAPLVSAQLERSGQKLNGRLEFEDIAPDFRARSGFIQRIGDARMLGQVGTSFFGPRGAFVERVGVNLKWEGFFDHDGLRDGDEPIESELELQPSFTIRGSNTVNVILRSGQHRFTPADFAGYEVQQADGSRTAFATPVALERMLGLAVMPRLRLGNQVQVDGRLFLREVPIFLEGVRGFEFQLAPNLRLWPTDGLALELSLTRSRLWRGEENTLFSTQSISRVKAQYQFSKAMFARAIVQYNLIERDSLHDPASGLPIVRSGNLATASERGEFGANLLLAYQPSPGTLVYVGWTRQMTGPDTYRLRDMQRAAEGLFVKLSYLHRL